MNVLPFSKTYDSRRVLDFPGITLEPGKIYGIIGANGSGKSTFAKILADVLPSDQRKQVLNAKVGYMPQKSFAFRMSTRANLMLGNKDFSHAEALMDAFQLRPLAQKRADRLSGGETARMALARLMMKQFDLVILDEPTAAMDIEMTAAAENQILQYTRETGCCTILVTHSLQQAKRVADEILFFHKGTLTESGPKETLLTAPQTSELRTFLEFYR